MAEGGPVAQDRLKSFIERIERLEEEKAALMADIKEVYAEAKGTGFDVKTMRKVISLRKMEENDRRYVSFGARHAGPAARRRVIVPHYR